MDFQIQALTREDALWHPLIDYARCCSWRAGKELAQNMEEGLFSGWERVFAALEGGEMAGYCTLARRDCLPDVPYTPYIGYVFVDERYRGRQLCGWLLEAAMQYARGLHFTRVYLVSDHQGLYERYGFERVDERPAPWDSEKVETIFMHLL